MDWPAARASVEHGRHGHEDMAMAKGGRETKKPKKEVAKVSAAAPSTKGTSSVTIGKQTAKK